MFFQFAAWNQNLVPNLEPTSATIEALFQLHPRTLLEALEIYYATRGVPAGYPTYGLPPAFRLADIAAPNLLAQILAAPANMRFDHAMYAYLIENTRIFEIFDRVVREYEAGERFETPDLATAQWLRTTEALFYRDLSSGSVLAMSSWLRPDTRALRRNTYYRLLGLDLNHGQDGNRAYPFAKPEAANRDFVPTFEAFLREVWKGVVNSANAVGPNETDRSGLIDQVRRLRDMLRVRRNNGNLVLEEYWSVVTMSWFHLTLMQNTPVIRALKAEAESPSDRLRKLGERVGIPAHARADNYFNMAFPISNLLTFIETDPNADAPAQAPGYYMPGGPTPQIAADLRTIITHWSEATGRDIKATRVLTGMAQPSGARPSRLAPPAGVPMIQNRIGETVS